MAFDSKNTICHYACDSPIHHVKDAFWMNILFISAMRGSIWLNYCRRDNIVCDAVAECRQFYSNLKFNVRLNHEIK